MTGAAGVSPHEDPIQLMAAIVTSAGDAIVGRGLDGTILTWNESAERLFGYRSDEMVGAKTDRLIPPEQRPDAARLYERAASGHMVELAHAVRIAHNGRRIDVGLTISPIRNRRGRPIGTSTIYRDIGEQLRIQEEQRLRERLAAAERLAAGLAGEFNDLVTAITSYADLLILGLDPDDPRHADALAIRRSADGAVRLTRRLEALARQRPLEPALVDLNALVVATLPRLRDIVGPTIGVERVPNPLPLPRVRTDRAQLEEALTLVARFARARMPDGGVLSLALERTDPPPADTPSPAADPGTRGADPRRGPWVRLTAADAGIPLDDDARRSLFEPYSPAVDATGIELAAARRIVQGLGGSMRALPPDAAAGAHQAAGLVIALDLPAVRAEEDVRPPVADRQPRGGDESILVVDDDPAVLSVIVKSLERLGYSVQQASTGEEALAIADNYFAEPVDMLIVDVVLPGMTGPELADRLLVDRPRLEVLYISGYTPNTVAYHGRAGLESAFLRKPFTPDGLGRRVRDLLDARARRAAG
jgi:two-component system cell cycle sensor histidine kinase/response regulator CckA